MTENNEINNETVIRIEQGTAVTIENQNGPEPIRVMVVNSHSGTSGYKPASVGATVADVVGEVQGEVRRNGAPTSMDAPVSDGDKISVTPENPEGN